MKQTISIITAYIALTALALSANLQGLFYNCFSAVDFGIYLQGIYGLAHGELNPYVSVRHLKLFSDHFDPINFLPALIMKLTVIHPAVLMTFEWAVIIAFSVIVFCLARKRFSLNMSLMLGLLIFLNKPILMALRFPVHPTTWSSIPLFFVSYYLFERRTTAVFISALSLLVFKESYPFAIFTLGVWYFLQKEIKTSVIFIGSSILAVIGIFILRPWIIGDTYSHAGLLFQDSQGNLMGFLVDRFLHFRYFDLLKNLLPFLILSFIYLKKQKTQLGLKHPFVGMLFFLAPLLAMQFLGNRFEFHYGAMFTALFFPLLFQADIQDIFAKQKKLSLFILALFIFNAGADIEKIDRKSVV